MASLFLGWLTGFINLSTSEAQFPVLLLLAFGFFWDSPHRKACGSRPCAGPLCPSFSIHLDWRDAPKWPFPLRRRRVAHCLFPGVRRSVSRQVYRGSSAGAAGFGEWSHRRRKPFLKGFSLCSGSISFFTVAHKIAGYSLCHCCARRALLHSFIAAEISFSPSGDDRQEKYLFS